MIEEIISIALILLGVMVMFVSLIPPLVYESVGGVAFFLGLSDLLIGIVLLLNSFKKIGERK